LQEIELEKQTAWDLTARWGNQYIFTFHWLGFSGRSEECYAIYYC